MHTLSLPILLLVAVAGTQAQSNDSCGAIPIELWGGSPLNRTTELVKPVKLVVVQHTVTNECSTDAGCEYVIRKIRKNHKLLGLPDIAQSFIVGGNGKVYEGAGWKQGYLLNYNDRAISISFIGDFREKLPNPEALQAARNFLTCSINNDDLDSNYNLVGHQQLASTLSPGAALQCFIQTLPHWRRNVSSL